MATDNPQENEAINKASGPPWLKLLWAGMGGTALGMGIIAFATTRASTAIAPTHTTNAQPNRSLNMVNLYGCQYLVIEPPFTIVHHGGCTNRNHWVNCATNK